MVISYNKMELPCLEPICLQQLDAENDQQITAIPCYACEYPRGWCLL